MLMKSLFAKPFSLLAAAIFMFSACQSAAPKPAEPTATTPSSTTTSTAAAAPVAAPAPEPTPAALTKYVVLNLPYKLEAGLMEGDLDQLDWGVGSQYLIKTPDNLYAILECKSIDDALIEFELKGIDKNGAFVGKPYPITYFQAMADAAGLMVNTAEINIDGNNITIKEESSYDGKKESGSSTTLKITAQGIAK